MPTEWSQQDRDFIEYLKINTVQDAAELAGYSRVYATRKLHHMRQKYKKARKIINVYENWRKHQRLDKLLSDGSINEDE